MGLLTGVGCLSRGAWGWRRGWATREEAGKPGERAGPPWVTVPNHVYSHVRVNVARGPANFIVVPVARVAIQAFKCRHAEARRDAGLSQHSQHDRVGQQGAALVYGNGAPGSWARDANLNL